MPDAESWTIGRLLKWTTEYLGGHGATSPRLDAEVLLAEAISCQRIELYTAFDSLPDERVRLAFRELVRRRADGEPVAYLVGHREFYSLSFRVTKDVLIPRPETEFLVITAIDLLRERSASGPATVCDVGTGSGIIAVCLAKHLPDCRVTALDISPAALEVARSNAASHDVAERVEFVQSDLFASIPAEASFDLVASNPPYVSQSELESLEADVREYEPHSALLAGPRGTEVFERLLAQAADHLKPGGHLLVEISPMIHDAARRLVETDRRFTLEPTVKDQAQLPRVVRATRN